jgi:hypothetical protein
MHRSLAIVLLACACAAGGVAGQEGKMDAPSQQRDGSFVTDDAPKRPPDARPVDAPPPDAAIDAPSGPFCSTNSQCTTAGECCVTLGGPAGFCAPGTVVLGVCVPQ